MYVGQCSHAVTPPVLPQWFLAERQADRDGPREAGEAGVTQWNQGDRRGEWPKDNPKNLIEQSWSRQRTSVTLTFCVSRVQVMDGRKATGGRVEVKIRLREPLSGQDMQTSTERWLVIDKSQVTLNIQCWHFCSRQTWDCKTSDACSVFFLFPRFLFRCCCKNKDASPYKGNYFYLNLQVKECLYHIFAGPCPEVTKSTCSHFLKLIKEFVYSIKHQICGFTEGYMWDYFFCMWQVQNITA